MFVRKYLENCARWEHEIFRFGKYFDAVRRRQKLLGVLLLVKFIKHNKNYYLKTWRFDLYLLLPPQPQENFKIVEDPRKCQNCRYVLTWRTDSGGTPLLLPLPLPLLFTTTKNVRIIVLPSHSCWGTLQSLYRRLLYSSMQTSADGLNGQRQVSRMTDEKGETWSYFGMSTIGFMTQLTWAFLDKERLSVRTG